jgi:tricarballylate dehydrogenase
MFRKKKYDLLVIGGGNAGLSAAITAREKGADVLVVEAAPEHSRGGNSRHVRNLRCMHDDPEGVLQDAYTFPEYWEDLQQVTGGNTNETLARLTLKQSGDCYRWMQRQGIRFQPALSGTLQLSRTNAFFLGGGKAMLNSYYRKANDLGIDIAYETEVCDLDIRDGRFLSAQVAHMGNTDTISAKAVVAASGGYQANLEWLRDAWGPAAENFIIRGTPYDNGRVLRLLMDNGAESVGDPAQCHAIAVDARSPRFDGGIVTRVDCITLGIVVNRDAVRFYDEGEDFWPKRYAIWGRLIAGQPGQIAYVIIDSKSAGLYLPPLTPPVRAQSISELASALDLSPVALEGTVKSFNKAVRPGSFNHSVLDGCSSSGIDPPKSHWARPIDVPPYFAYPLRPGITFTYLGVAVNEKAQMMMKGGIAAENIYAAGEIMAGNILGKGYLAGIGMTIGTTFGRIAGRESTTHV